jgi:hypothetical protein
VNIEVEAMTYLGRVFRSQPMACGEARQPLSQTRSFNYCRSTINFFDTTSTDASFKHGKSMTTMSRSHIFSTLHRRSVLHPAPRRQPSPFASRQPAFAQRRYQHHQQRESYGARMRAAWNGTRVKWYSIPVAAGIGFLAARQLYKNTTRERARIAEAREDGEDGQRPPKRRKKIRPSGPW